MRITFLNLYPSGSLARYLLSSYVLKAYLMNHLNNPDLYKFSILNMSVNAPTERIVAKLESFQPDIICHSSYLWNISKIEDTIFKFSKDYNAVHILGGPEISKTSIARLAAKGIGNYYVTGEGERPLTSLLDYLSQEVGIIPQELPAGVTIHSNGHLVSGGPPEFLDLSTVPSVYLSGAMEQSLYHRQQAYIETQRGCKNKCAYCVYHKSLPKIQYYPLEKIKNELDHLILKNDVTALRIFDALFSSDIKRAKAFIRHLIEIKNILHNQGKKNPWIYWEFYYTHADDEFLSLISDLKYQNDILNSYNIQCKNKSQLYSDFVNGYSVINCIGIQSFNQKSLRAVHRPAFAPKKFEEFIGMVRKHNILLKVDMIYGLPFETEESFWRGIEILLPLFERSDHILNLHRLQMLPGSDLETNGRSLGLVWDQEHGHLVRSTSTMSQDQMQYGSHLLAMLFRLVNSPLRREFFATWNGGAYPARSLCEAMLKAARTDSTTATSRLVTEVEVDDVYWNDACYHEIPSEWARHHLKQIAMKQNQ